MKNISLSILAAVLLVAGSFLESHAQTASAGTVDTTFTPFGKFSGQFFGDYSYKVHGDSLGRGSSEYSTYKKAFADMQLRRVYLGYTFYISRTFSTDWLAAYEEGSGATLGSTTTGGATTLDAAGERTFYMKIANIRWKNIFSNADLVFGAQATPSFVPSSETQWGYRSIEKTLLDKYGIAKSSDVGLGLYGSFDDAHNFGYDLLYANATGQLLETDRFKKIYGALWGKFMDQKIYVNLYGDLNRTSDVPAKDVSTMKLYVAYTTVPLTIGVEAFMQTLTNNAVDSNFSSGKRDTSSVKPFGISVFATGQIIPNSLNFFARFDMLNPDQNFESSGVSYYGTVNTTYLKGYYTNNETFFVAGVDYTPYKNVHIMPNIWYQGYSSKLSNVSGALKSDYELVPRVTVFYKF